MADGCPEERVWPNLLRASKIIVKVVVAAILSAMAMATVLRMFSIVTDMHTAMGMVMVHRVLC